MKQGKVVCSAEPWFWNWVGGVFFHQSLLRNSGWGPKKGRVLGCMPHPPPPAPLNFPGSLPGKPTWMLIIGKGELKLLASAGVSLLRSFSNNDRDDNEKVKKSNRFIKQNNNYHTFLYFLCHHCKTAMWKCLISRLWKMSKCDNEFFFPFLNLSAVPKNSTPKKFAYICHFQQIEINATQF